jgi:hypothetical protein
MRQHSRNQNLTPRRQDPKTPRNQGLKLLAPWSLGVLAVKILSAWQWGGLNALDLQVPNAAPATLGWSRRVFDAITKFSTGFSHGLWL